MKKVMICGGAGYLGSHATKIMAERGYDVVVVDNLATGHIEAIDKRAKFYNVDIRQVDELTTILVEEKIDGVIHFAANSIVPESMKEPLKYFDNNVYGTQCLLKAMNMANVNKIVFSSSAAVYGEVEVMPIKEDIVPNPTNPYGQTKYMMEQMMKWCDKAYGLKYVSLRYFNVAGAYIDGSIGEDHNPETHLIPLILQVPLNKREKINVCGTDYNTEDGTCVRDYIHMHDLIDAHILALEYLFADNQSDIFNLGSGTGYSVLEIIKTTEEVIGKEINKEIVGRRPGDPAKLIASSDKAERILKWQRKYDIKDIISDAWKWHSNNPMGYKTQK